MSIEDLRQRLVEVFNTYSAAIEDSPNAKWLQIAQRHGVENIQRINFIPYAVIDDDSIPMVGKQNLGKYSTGKHVYYGYSTEDEVRKAVEKLRKYPAYQNASYFKVMVQVNDETIGRFIIE